METNINLENIVFTKMWLSPKPKHCYDTPTDYTLLNDYIKVNQQKFIDEYFTSGHKVMNKDFLKDYFIQKKGINPLTNKTEIEYEQVHVERLTFPIQKDSTDVILAHIFGRKIEHKDISFDKTPNNDELLRKYKLVWSSTNMDSIVKTFVKHTLICAEAVLYFYINQQGEIKTQILSLLNGDKIAVQKDNFGNVIALYRQYYTTNENAELEQRIDKITIEGIGTYNDKGELINFINNVFNFLPLVYHYRKEGAWWSSVQSSIDELEKMCSLLAEDNKSKAKAKLHLATQKPNNVQAQTLAGADVIITGTDGKVELLQPAALSESLSFIIKKLETQIAHTLGLIYPELKSGDMPTGSMKLAFFPTERICKTFIDEFAPVIDQISKIFKKTLPIQYSTFRNTEFDNMFIKSKIALYSPQDSLSTLTASADAFSKGALTEEALIRANSDYLDTTDLDKLIEINKKEIIDVTEEVTPTNTNEKQNNTTQE